LDTSDFRKPTYLSPSALACWEKSPDEYFNRYVIPSDVRPPRPPQTDPMSVGSAFDALVKNRINVDLNGYWVTKESEYALCDLIRTQCEEHTLPESLVIACDLFEQYVECNAYGALLETIRAATIVPRMEFTVRAEISGVPLLGKPDLHFNTAKFCEVITDWKVSGSVSKRGVSPQQGYMICKDIHGSRSNGESHKRFQPSLHESGLIVNGWKMNESTDYWADQLTTYAWALGHAVGDESWVARIEQIACRPAPATATDDRLRAKCVVHQSTVDRDYQYNLIERYQRCWSHVEKGHYWPELSLTESQARGNLIVHQLRNPVTLLTEDTLPEIQW